jgi:hypothetical protein
MYKLPTPIETISQLFPVYQDIQIGRAEGDFNTLADRAIVLYESTRRFNQDMPEFDDALKLCSAQYFEQLIERIGKENNATYTTFRFAEIFEVEQKIRDRYLSGEWQKTSDQAEGSYADAKRRPPITSRGLPLAASIAKGTGSIGDLIRNTLR